MTKEDIGTRVVQAVDDAKKPQDNLIHLSTGVVLRGKQAPPMILMAIMGSFPRPKPPVYRSEEMGRDVENPENPDYLSRVQAWQAEQSEAVLNALIISGSEFVSKPDKMPGPEDKEWLEEYEMLNLPMRRENAAWRYLRWVQYKAAVTADDTKLIMQVVGRLSGVPEKTVQSAEQFSGSDQTDRG